MRFHGCSFLLTPKKHNLASDALVLYLIQSVSASMVSPSLRHRGCIVGVLLWPGAPQAISSLPLSSRGSLYWALCTAKEDSLMQVIATLTCEYKDMYIFRIVYFSIF